MKRANNKNLPLARKADLVVREIPDEVLVYDLKRDKAYCLNQTAAFVWKKSNGRKTVVEVTRLLEQERKEPVDEKVVWLAVDQLEKMNLMASRTGRPPHLPRLSRRDMMRAMGVAASVGLPLVTAIIAPRAVSPATLITKAECDKLKMNPCGGNACSDAVGICQPDAMGNCMCI